MVDTSPRFSDLKNSWARPFIEGLAQRGIVSGFPDGTFRPNEAMNRAQFAAILLKAFQKPSKRKYASFVDVPSKHWAAAAIQKAYESEFLSGYPDKRFRLDDKITKVQVLISLVSGLGIASNNTSYLKFPLSQFYEDADQIPDYATDKVAAATGASMVVNYPTLKSLKPNQVATRADVAAFIYQALVHIGQVPSIQSDYIVVPPDDQPQRVNVGHVREFRGVWVATVWNLDWPSNPGLPVEQQKAEFIQIIEQLQAMNFNAIVLQVRPEGDAIYSSQLEPWSHWLTGTQGQAPVPFYDPLEFAIAESHKRNIELHAWFNPFRAKTTLIGSQTVSPHITRTNPECVYQYGNALWMDPGSAVVQQRAYDVILDVVRRYDVDGIQIDDYFYPYPIAGQSFPDNKTYADYQAAGGKMILGDWRRSNINQMIQRLAAGIRAEKRHVKFGISPFGIFRPGQPAGIQGLDTYEELYTDSQKWLVEGWVDYFAPQLYWRIDPPGQSYPVLLKWWTEQNPKRKHIYAGNNLGQLDGQSWKIEEITRQVEITRSYKNQLSLGNIYYSMKAFKENSQGVYENFKSSTYATPALVPTMPDLDAAPPAFPTGVAVKNGQIIWNPAAGGEIRSWTLYKQDGDSWKLLRVLPVATTSVSVDPGTYALCAADRMANESQGVVVAVK